MALHFQQQVIDLGEIPVNYARVQADAPPMLVLHGIGMDWRVWQAVARRFSPSFDLYLMDLRGHGHSGKPRHGYSLADYASDVEQLITALDLRRVALVGSSLGGMVAAIVEESANRVACRVLVDPPLVRGSGPKRPLFEQILSIKQSNVSREDECQLIFRALQGESEGAGNTFVRYMAETWTAAAVGVLEEALHPIEKPEQIDATLTSIDSPVLLLRGNEARGSVLPEATARRGLSLLPKGSMVYFPNSGHAIHGTEPARFAQVVADFAAASAVQPTPSRSI